MGTDKIILAFTGQMASGKGTACAYFIEKYGARMFRYSTILRDLLDRIYLPHSRDNLQELSRVVREKFGQDLMAKVIAHDVAVCSDKLIVVDGARRVEDVEFLNKLPGFKLVAITASPEIRYARITGRDENPDDKAKTWEAFIAEGQAEAEMAIPRLMERADFTIANSKDVASFKAELESLYQKISNESQS